MTLDVLSILGEEKVQETFGLPHVNIDMFQRISGQMETRGHKRLVAESQTRGAG